MAGTLINIIMIFAFVTLFVALAIAGIAAWFSIVGLMAIFTGAALSIAIMAGALEAGKLVAASWLYRYWKTSPAFLKLYLTVAVVVLMVITSMGIFGYLSRAHIEHTAGLGTNQLVIESINRDIERAERARDAADQEVSRLDSAVEEMVSRGFATRGLQTRQEQAEERQALGEIARTSESTIAELESQRTELELQIQALEREVGPILYLAQLIYGEDDRDTLEETVRLLVIILVLVFDPLAIALLLAANFALMRHGMEIEKQDAHETQEEQATESPEIPEPDADEESRSAGAVGGVAETSPPGEEHSDTSDLPSEVQPGGLAVGQPESAAQPARRTNDTPTEVGGQDKVMPKSDPGCVGKRHDG
jgi:hypothetical protein